MEWSVTFLYLPLIGKGLVATVILSTLGLLGGTVLGIILALLQLSRQTLAKIIATGWILLFRSIPLLLLLFLAYYVSPILLGVDISAFVFAVVGLNLYSSSYAAEIIRTGLLAVPRIQSEAGLTLGLSKAAVLRLIVLPQALRIILPSYMGLYTVVIKDSSLVVVLGYIELTRATRIAVEITYEPFPFYLLALLLYFMLCYPISIFSQNMERRIHGE